MSKRLSEATRAYLEAARAYQVYLEADRTIREGDFDTEFVVQMSEDLEKARVQMEIAWLEAAVMP